MESAVTAGPHEVVLFGHWCPKPSSLKNQPCTGSLPLNVLIVDDALAPLHMVIGSSVPSECANVAHH